MNDSASLAAESSRIEIAGQEIEQVRFGKPRQIGALAEDRLTHRRAGARTADDKDRSVRSDSRQPRVVEHASSVSSKKRHPQPAEATKRKEDF